MNEEETQRAKYLLSQIVDLKFGDSRAIGAIKRELSESLASYLDTRAFIDDQYVGHLFQKNEKMSFDADKKRLIRLINMAIDRFGE